MYQIGSQPIPRIIVKCGFFKPGGKQARVANIFPHAKESKRSMNQNYASLFREPGRGLFIRTRHQKHPLRPREQIWSGTASLLRTTSRDLPNSEIATRSMRSPNCIWSGLTKERRVRQFASCTGQPNRERIRQIPPRQDLSGRRPRAAGPKAAAQLTQGRRAWEPPAFALGRLFNRGEGVIETWKKPIAVCLFLRIRGTKLRSICLESRTCVGMRLQRTQGAPLPDALRRAKQPVRTTPLRKLYLYGLDVEQDSKRASNSCRRPLHSAIAYAAMQLRSYQ